MRREGAVPRIVEQLQRLPGLGAVEQALGSVADAVLGPAGPAVRDALNGTWLGHAVHPALSDVPIGLWASSALADVLGMDRAAQSLGTAGSAAAVATAATGMADWRNTAGPERRIGTLHASLNTVGLTLQLGALAARSRGSRGTARALTLSGLAVAAAGAWLGGDLVFGRGTMVDRLAWTAGPEDWTAALPADLDDGETRCASVEGRPILVSRRGDAFHAIEATCAHAGGPLCEGEIADGTVTCPWHGSRFDVVDGSLRGGPATFPQVRLDVRVRGGQLEVRGRSE